MYLSYFILIKKLFPPYFLFKYYFIMKSERVNTYKKHNLSLTKDIVCALMKGNKNQTESFMTFVSSCVSYCCSNNYRCDI